VPVIEVASSSSCAACSASWTRAGTASLRRESTDTAARALVCHCRAPPCLRAARSPAARPAVSGDDETARPRPSRGAPEWP
jgi:hypothetical protein